MVTLGDAAHKERIDSERNQGRAPNMDWLDHDRLGFNYRLSDSRARSGSLSSIVSTRCSPVVPALRALYGEALAGLDELALPCPDAGRRAAGLVRVRRPAPAGLDRDGVVRDLAALGVPSKPYFPAVHLMSYYRETFGHRPGEFPGVRGRRGPFDRAAVLPGDDRGPGRAGRRGAPRRARRRALVRSRLRMSRFSEPQHEAFRRLNDSIGFDWRLAPYDIEQSRAHAAMLAAQGIISEEDRAALDRALGQVHARAERRIVPVRRRRRGHPHGDRAAGDRAGRPGGRATAHRALTQRPGRDRRGDVRARARVRRRDLDRAARFGGDRRRRATSRLADARLHPSPAGATGVPEPSPARIRVDACT